MMLNRRDIQNKILIFAIVQNDNSLQGQVWVLIFAIVQNANSLQEQARILILAIVRNGNSLQGQVQMDSREPSVHYHEAGCRC
jgi:hypothetical protein